MAKKRTARRSRSFNFSKKRRSSRTSSGDGNLMMTIIGSALYGAGRQYVSDAVAPVTAKIPLGNIADEVLLGTLGYFAAKGKFGNFPLLKSVGKAALVIESARIGQSVADGTLMQASAGSNNGLGATIF